MSEVVLLTSKKSPVDTGAPPQCVDHRAPAVANGRTKLAQERSRIGFPARGSARTVERNPTTSDLELSVRTSMLEAIPRLRAFAVSLSRNPERADDLVQETLLRAWSDLGRFEPGTNMGAWLTTILRNEFYSESRKRRRQVEDVDGRYAETLVVQAEQITCTEYAEFLAAFAKLPAEMRKALILVGVSGLSYADAARICACANGTIKSRVHRARARLAAMLSLENSTSFIEDAISQSIIVQAEHGRFHHAS